MLSVAAMTNEIGKAGGSGLGITRKITHNEIYDAVSKGSLSAQKRLDILSMMLQVSDPKAWDNLGEDGEGKPALAGYVWIPRKGGGLSAAEDCILPIPRLKEHFGDSHPHYTMVDVDFNDETVLDHAEKIGLLHQEDSLTLLKGLLGPKTPPKADHDILTQLALLYKDDEARPAGAPQRKSRLPKGKKGWSDASKICKKTGDIASLKIAFGGYNIRSEEDLGKTTTAMLKHWVLEEPYEFTIHELLIELKKASASKDDTALAALWPMVLKRNGEESPHWPERLWDASELRYVHGEGRSRTALSVGDILIVSYNEHEGIAKEVVNQVILDDIGEVSDALVKRFHVKECGKLQKEDFRDMMLKFGNETEYLVVERMLICLATCHIQPRELVGVPWPIRTVGGSSPQWSKGRPDDFTSPDCLIPERKDPEELSDSLLDGGIHILELGESVSLRERLYDILEQGDDNPSISVPWVSRKTTSKGDATGADRTQFDVLEGALRNIFDAMDRMDIRAKRHPESIQAWRTTAKGSIEYAVWRKKEVKIGRSSMVEGLSCIMDEERLIVEVVLGPVDHSDVDLMHKTMLAVSVTENGWPKFNKLFMLKEDQWASVIDERLTGYDIHERPLIEEGLFHHLHDELRGWYEGCQVCGQVTPKDKSGVMFSEGVQNIYKISSRYADPKLPYDLGCVLYLCPVHSALLRRSRKDVFEIVEIEKLYEHLGQHPENLDKMISGLRGKPSDEASFSLHFRTFERRTKEKLGTIEWEVGNELSPEHANKFKSTLIQHLRNKYGS
jgi:hypothetical protein